MYFPRNVFVFAFLLLQPANGWWPFGDSSTGSSAEETGEERGSHLKNSPVPFEMTTAEEKFLAEAKKYMGDLTPLDSCHQLVINRIKKSCGDINEEELGKLGVALLNCQSKSEGRRTYECSEEMALRECTMEMDANTWNSYHIISNRARSICYATRQQQFRLKTEYTVNQLAHQAENQMDLMNNLQNGQRLLVETAEDTVIKVNAGQERLVRQQRQLHSSYQDVQRSLSVSLRGNINALNKEKGIIEMGRKQLKEMAKTVKEKLENATLEIQKQDVDRKRSHRQILEDLSNIRNKAQEVWNKIDHSTLQMMSYHTETTQHYKDTLENLKTINETIVYLLKVTNQMQDKIDDRLNWLSNHLGGTGDKLAVLSVGLLHVGYFLVATLCILFLNAPLFTRLFLLILVPVNAWCEIRFRSSLTYGTLSVFLVLALLGNWLYFFLKNNFFYSNVDNLLNAPKSSPLALNDRSCFSGLHHHSNHVLTPSNTMYSSSSLSSLEDTALPGTSKTPVDRTKRQLDLSYPDYTSTPSPKLSTSRRRCGAATKSGSACRRMIVSGRTSCASHSRIQVSHIQDDSI